MDTRTRQLLIDQGHISERGLTRQARYRHCPHCGLVLFAGLGDMAREIWCDPWPITIAGELGAVLTGRDTYCAPSGGLNRRLFDRIAFRNANEEPVYAEHVCGQRQPEINHLHVKPRVVDIHDDDKPPF